MINGKKSRIFSLFLRKEVSFNILSQEENQNDHIESLDNNEDLSQREWKHEWWFKISNSFLKSSFTEMPQVKSLPHTIDDYKISGALINKYYRRLCSDTGNKEINRLDEKR